MKINKNCITKILIFLLIMPAIALANEIAIIIKSSGDVQLIQTSGKRVAEVSVGDMFEIGDVIITGKDGMAAVKFLDDKSTINVLAQSSLKITTQGKGRRVVKKIRLQKGKVYVDASKSKKQGFIVETGTTEARIKGSKAATEIKTELDKNIRTVYKDCKISFYLGEVVYRKAGVENWSPAEIGKVLVQGDILSTMQESRAELTLLDGSKVSVGENSMVEIKTLDNKNDQRTFKLMRGSLSATIKKLTSTRASFKVETPVAIAAIRGTDFKVLVNEDLSITVSVTEGKVLVTIVDLNISFGIEENRSISITPQGDYSIKPLVEKAGEDVTPPELKLFSPKRGGIFDTSAIRIQGKTEAGADVFVNETKIDVDEQGNFETQLKLPEGSHTLHIKAIDKALNSIEIVVPTTVSLSADSTFALDLLKDEKESKQDTLKTTVITNLGGKPILVIHKTKGETLEVKPGFTAFQAERGATIKESQQKVMKLEFTDEKGHTKVLEIELEETKQ